MARALESVHSASALQQSRLVGNRDTVICPRSHRRKSTAPSLVVTHRFARSPSPSHVISPCSPSSIVSRSCLFSRKALRALLHFHTSVAQPLHTVLRCALEETRKRKGHRRRGSVFSVVYLHVPVYVAIWRFHKAHIFSFDMPQRQFSIHVQLRLPSLYFSRVSRIFRDAVLLRPEFWRFIDAYEAIRHG